MLDDLDAPAQAPPQFAARALQGISAPMALCRRAGARNWLRPVEDTQRCP